jgi:hypothetical protein
MKQDNGSAKPAKGGGLTPTAQRKLRIRKYKILISKLNKPVR